MKKILIIICAGLCAASCTKKLSVENPDFTVDLDAAKLVSDTFTYKLGDTAKFMFGGYAGNVVFYSGEAGKRYEFRNRSNAFGNPILAFSSKAEFGAQTNTLQILATNKLAALDSATVVNAAWTDITSKAILSTSATVVASGNINLKDLVTNESDSLFLAFKYSGVTGSVQRTWTITNYAVTNTLPTINGVADASYAAASIANDASFWKSYGNVWSPANAKWVPTTTALTIVGGGATAPTNTAWLVSKPIYTGRLVPDVPVIIKSINAALPTLPNLNPGYLYKYPAVGTYRATFVAFNNSIKEQETVVKEFWVKIVP